MSEWTREQELKFVAEMRSESDRGCVLLCAALIDRGLEKLLRLKFEKSSDASSDEINKVLTKFPDAALANLTIRARFARVLGLISKETSDAIRKFAYVRNGYAHEDDPPKLSKATGNSILALMPRKFREGAEYKRLYDSRPENIGEAKWGIIFATICLHSDVNVARRNLSAAD